MFHKRAREAANRSSIYNVAHPKRTAVELWRACNKGLDYYRLRMVLPYPNRAGGIEKEESSSGCALGGAWGAAHPRREALWSAAGPATAHVPPLSGQGRGIPAGATPRQGPAALGHFVPLSGAPGHQPKMAPGRLPTERAGGRAATAFLPFALPAGPAAIFPRRGPPQPPPAPPRPQDTGGGERQHRPERDERA